MVHFFQSIQGWFSYAYLYEHIVNSCNYNDQYHFVEIGSWKGRSSSFMAVEILNSNKNIKFDCIDTWSGSEEHYDPNNNVYEPSLLIDSDYLYNLFLMNTQPVKHIINPIRKPSIQASELYNDNSLDFILIDAAHDYDNVLLFAIATNAQQRNDASFLLPTEKKLKKL
jgi:hypothetical protein